MKIHIIHTLISAMVFWGVYGPGAALSAEDNQSFLVILNEIRKAPYDYAIEHLEDCTPESLIAMGIEPGSDFEPYTLDEDLTAMAADESQRMAGEKVLEPKRPVHRLTELTGGVVSFFNFMPRDTAFRIVINYLLKKELDPNNDSPRCILSEKTYSSVGIAISAGKVGSGNAWFVAICFGSPELVSEIQMLNLINQVRADPEKIWEEYTNLTQKEAYERNRNIYSLFTEYKPLFFNSSLSESAQAHSSYVLNGMYPEELSEAQTDLQRAEYYGYKGEVVQEGALKMNKLHFSTEEKGLSVESAFLWLIGEELEDSPKIRVTFSNYFQDVGSNTDFQPGEISDTSVLSFVVGKKDPNASTDENADINNEQPVRIYGILFSDNDRNGLYAPGEEEKCIQQTVTAYNIETQESQSAVTDNAGHFFMTLRANEQYRFTATIDGVPVGWEGNDGNHLITSDQFVKLFYSPPSIE
ncbi:hypothetical protein [Desulfobacter postgatei]|uniref:hypothetical protein n=1 Tax=Desulfobacter postgatei TaxID=2293 RepID=UPI00259BBDBA|nr:hypothetical protein [uncultured Desulfobacter sp.]